jgi:hypothetical protein
MKRTPLDLAAPSCGGCVFFQLSEEVETESSGICRRFPPSVFIDGDGDMAKASPFMLASEWCGEFKAKQ